LGPDHHAAPPVHGIAKHEEAPVAFEIAIAARGEPAPATSKTPAPASTDVSNSPPAGNGAALPPPPPPVGNGATIPPLPPVGKGLPSTSPPAVNGAAAQPPLQTVARRDFYGEDLD
jgi:hypothetical protein